MNRPDLVLLQSRIQYVFNRIQLNFIKEIKNKDSELKKTLKKNYKIYDKLNNSYITYFLEQLTDSFTNILHKKDNDIFEEDDVKKFLILKEVTISNILDIVQKNEYEVVKCYIYMLYMFSYLYNEVLDIFNKYNDDDQNLENNEELNQKYTEINTLFNKCMRITKLLNEEEFQREIEDICDDDLDIILRVIYNTRVNIKNSPVQDSSEDFDVDKTVDPSEGLDTAYDFLNNSKIGELAKEISEDIDVSNLNVERPEDLLNVDQMFKGENGNFLGEIIGKVSSKITNKIQQGDIKQEELMNEAFSMMTKLNGTNGFMEEMMQNAMKHGGSAFKQNNEMMRNMNTKARLQKKLQDKQNNN